MVTGLLAGAGGAGAIAYYSAQPALAITANFADDVSISTDDGTITDVSLGENLSVILSWSGLDTKPNSTDIDINVKSADTDLTSYAQLVGVEKQALSDNTLSGSDTIGASDFGSAPFSIIDATGGDLIASDFESSTDGETKDTTVTLQVVAKIFDSDNTMIEENTSTDSYVVSVTNKESTSDTSGTADTQVSG